MKPPITMEYHPVRWGWRTWVWLAAAVLSTLAFIASAAFTVGYFFTRFFS